MAGRFAAKVRFVIPLHLGHRQKAVDHFVLAALGGEHRRIFILDDVAALQPAGAVHRSEPSADVTEAGDEVTDPPEDEFAQRARFAAELPQQPADELAVMPLLGFDLPDVIALARVAHAVPMASVRIAGPELRRVGDAELADEFCAGVGGHRAEL